MASSSLKAKGKVTGSAGRFGCRYGRFVRKRVCEIEKISRALHRCPKCDMESVARKGTGIWECRKCGYKFAGRHLPARNPGHEDRAACDRPNG